MPETVLACLPEAAVLPLADGPDQTRRLAFVAAPGLYQFSVIYDGRQFDWERLYVTLNQFHNDGVRSGPWDFDLTRQNEPVVPSYWVTLDGRPLGLWYAERVSLEDLAAKRFRGRLAFHLATGGTHELTFRPFREMTVNWLGAKLEADPEDTLDPRRFDLATWPARCPAARWAEPAWWARQATRLATSHAMYAPALQGLYAWLRRKVTPAAIKDAPPGTLNFNTGPKLHHHPEDILPLLAEYHLGGRAESLADALAAVDHAVAMPHWGNPVEGAYGCDGDMGAAHYLRALAWAWHALAPHLGDERRERLHAKLRLQGTRFFDQCLLHRDYWGGSVIQDHGKVSLASFGAAAIHLLGVLPEAETWVAFAIPRVARSLDAMPTDGHIPPSSYHSPILYLDNPTFYRDALLALTGEDIFDRPVFRAVVDYLAAMSGGLPEAELVRRQGHSLLLGATHFLNYMATKYGDGRAAFLQRQRLAVGQFKFPHGTVEHGYYHGMLWGFLTYDPAVAPVAPPPPASPLQVYPDSGVVRWWEPGADLELSLQCGPWCGYNAYRRAKGPCDRMEMLAGRGHFTIAVGGTPLLVSPDAGYRLKYHTRNLLLIDDQGPTGDIGYPMSIPSFRDRGEEVASARYDAAARCGHLLLNLAPAYADDLGLASYTREIVPGPGRRVLVRDHLVSSRAHRLAWHFHGFREAGVRLLGELGAAFGSSPELRLAVRLTTVPLTATVAPTEVVYSYSSAFKTFDHVRYATREAVSSATVEFLFTA